MKKVWQNCLGLVLMFGMLSSCRSDLLTPAISTPSPDKDSFALLSSVVFPMSEEEVKGLEDEDVRRILLQDRIDAGLSPPAENRLQGPRLAPRSPAQFSIEWVDVITLEEGQPLVGYLDIAASAQNNPEHDFLITLLVDYRQAEFELGGQTALAHVLRLPNWETRTYSFRMLEPLAPGWHDLIFIVHDDPYNEYATKGVYEKHRLEGKRTFDDAADRPWYRPFSNRSFVLVGGEGKYTWGEINWPVIAYQPRKMDLTNLPLLIGLTDDEADPLLQREPAMVFGDEQTLFAFVHDVQTPPGNLEGSMTALVAFLGNKQVKINGQETLFFNTKYGEYYKIPVDIDWPEDVEGGRVNPLYLGVAFGVQGEWQHLDGREAFTLGIPYFPQPVMIVPDRSLIDYLDR